MYQFAMIIFILRGTTPLTRVSGTTIHSIVSFSSLFDRPSYPGALFIFMLFQRRIQDFHLGGGGGAKDYVPAHTLRAQN